MHFAVLIVPGDLFLIIYLHELIEKDFVIFLKLCVCRKLHSRVVCFCRVQTWKLLTEMLSLAVLRVKAAEGVSSTLNIDLQSSYQQWCCAGVDNWKGKWRLSETLWMAHVFYSAHKKELWSQSQNAWWLFRAHASLITQWMERISNASFCEAVETQREFWEWPTWMWAKIFDSEFEIDRAAAFFSLGLFLVSFLLFLPSSLCEFMTQKLFILTCWSVISSGMTCVFIRVSSCYWI